MHYAQTIKYKRFAYFDYDDPGKNIQKYGQEKPPLIDLSSIDGSIPIGIIVGI
jgi:hypothetical protein